MIWAVDTGLDIYDLDFSGGDDYDPDAIRQDAQEMGTGDEEGRYTGMGLLATIGGASIIVIAGTLAATTVIGGLFKVQRASQAVVYGFFTTIFWYSYVSASNVLWSMTSTLSGMYGALVVLMIITAVIAYVFIVGLFQMVTGGWKSYE